tara:strand:+ start:495 stop:737 length:243 start_codon:yes stop_codon:yes gene_type:complete
VAYALQEVASKDAQGQERLTESNENRYPQTKQKKSQTHYGYEFEQIRLVDMYIPRVLGLDVSGRGHLSSFRVEVFLSSNR